MFSTGLQLIDEKKVSKTVKPFLTFIQRGSVSWWWS